jgi:SAM-dependent methyltransferase
MGIRVPKEKTIPLFVRLAYLVNRLPRKSRTSRLSLLLDLEWILNRLCHEESYALFSKEDHPCRQATEQFIGRVLPPGAVVLDIGCGSGDLTSVLARSADSVIGIDHDRDCIAVAQENHRLSNVAFLVGEAEECLASVETKFDVVVLSHVLEHLEAPILLLEQVSSRCGFVYLEVPDFEYGPNNEYRRILERPISFGDVDHLYEFDREELEALLREANLEVLSTSHRLGMLRFWCGTQRLH